MASTPSSRLTAVLAGVALFAVPRLLAGPVYRDLEGFVDDPMPAAQDLARLASESTEYLVTQRPAVANT